jgi:hypothetical protein
VLRYLSGPAILVGPFLFGRFSTVDSDATDAADIFGFDLRFQRAALGPHRGRLGFHADIQLRINYFYSRYAALPVVWEKDMTVL